MTKAVVILQRRQCWEERKQISKQNLMKQMLPGMNLIILANMNVKLFSWTFTFRKVVQQQIWWKVLVGF